MNSPPQLQSAAEHFLSAVNSLVDYERKAAGIQAPLELFDGRALTAEDALNFFLSLPLPSSSLSDSENAALRRSVYAVLRAELPEEYLANREKEHDNRQLQELWGIAREIGRILTSLAQSEGNKAGGQGEASEP